MPSCLLFCGHTGKPSAPFFEVATFIDNRLSTFYGMADDELPYDSHDGGYQGWHMGTYELLFNELDLSLPRDDQGTLARELVSAIGDRTWCRGPFFSSEFLALEWGFFCETVKYGRRFFFHNVGKNDIDPYSRSLSEFLVTLGKTIERFQLIKKYRAGYRFYRARRRRPGVLYTTPPDLGPPRSECAKQSNRMNPPGLPMMYGADKQRLACAEMFNMARQKDEGLLLSVGRFETLRPVQLLNLVNLPPVPGFFSQEPHDDRIRLSFLHGFAEEIKKPITGDDRNHIDYIPSQVFTEFIRDFTFATGTVDGILYRSATGVPGANIVIFAAQDDLIGGVRENSPDKGHPWLQLVSVKQIESSRAEYCSWRIGTEE